MQPGQDPQSDMYEVVHTLAEQPTMAQQQRGVTSREHQLGWRTEHAMSIRNQAFDHAAVPQQHTGIDRILRTAGQDGRDDIEAGAGQRGSPLLHPDHERTQSRRNGAATETSPRVHDVHSRRRPAIDHDRAPETPIRSQGPQPTIDTEIVSRLIVDDEGAGQVVAGSEHRAPLLVKDRHDGPESIAHNRRSDTHDRLRSQHELDRGSLASRVDIESAPDAMEVVETVESTVAPIDSEHPRPHRQGQRIWKGRNRKFTGSCHRGSHAKPPDWSQSRDNPRIARGFLRAAPPKRRAAMANCGNQCSFAAMDAMCPSGFTSGGLTRASNRGRGG